MNGFAPPAMPALDTGRLVSLSTLMVLLVITMFTELRSNRIPNWATVPGLLIGLVVGYLPGGISLGSSLGGFFIGFGFMFMFYMFGGMGGGDVKLMGAAGALMGYPLILTALVYTAIVGGLMAMLVLIWNRSFWRGMAHSMGMFFRLKRPADEDPEEVRGKMGTVPYGIAIICGCLMTVFLAGWSA